MKVYLMANDWPGCEVAKFLLKSGDTIERLYLHEPDKKNYTILIALPIALDDSIQIINQVILSLDDHSMKSLRFIVKLHPTMSISKIMSKFANKWPKSFEFINSFNWFSYFNLYF